MMHGKKNIKFFRYRLHTRVLHTQETPSKKEVYLKHVKTSHSNKLTWLVFNILLYFFNMAPLHYVAHYTFILVLCHLAISNVQIIRLPLLYISKAI